MQGPSPQEQLDKYMIELRSYGGTSVKHFWIDHQAVYHGLALLALDLSAPSSEAYVEHRLSSWLEMRVFLKLSNNILSWML